jgi:hypothetical protein
LDPDAGEFFNVGVAFTHPGGIEVRMLDSFERLRCLFDARVDTNDLARTLADIEAALFHFHQEGKPLPDTLGDAVRLGGPRYGAGESTEAVVDEFFADVVTLARPKRERAMEFRYQSTPKVRSRVLEHIAERMQLQASRIIQEERYRLRLSTGHHIDLDIPLLSEHAAGSVVSAWYKSPLVVENALLQAAADLHLVRSNSSRTQAAVSVLVPGEGSGLTRTEHTKLHAATRRQIDRMACAGIEVIEEDSTLALAEKTVDWWRQRVA